jgi:hypothetical protein
MEILCSSAKILMGVIQLSKFQAVNAEIEALNDVEFMTDTDTFKKAVNSKLRNTNIFTAIMAFFLVPLYLILNLWGLITSYDLSDKTIRY